MCLSFPLQAKTHSKPGCGTFILAKDFTKDDLPASKTRLYPHISAKMATRCKQNFPNKSYDLNLKFSYKKKIHRYFFLLNKCNNNCDYDLVSYVHCFIV